MKRTNMKSDIYETKYSEKDTSEQCQLWQGKSGTWLIWKGNLWTRTVLKRKNQREKKGRMGERTIWKMTNLKWKHLYKDNSVKWTWKKDQSENGTTEKDNSEKDIWTNDQLWKGNKHLKKDTYEKETLEQLQIWKGKNWERAVLERKNLKRTVRKRKLGKNDNS